MFFSYLRSLLSKSALATGLTFLVLLCCAVVKVHGASFRKLRYSVFRPNPENDTGLTQFPTIFPCMTHVLPCSYSRSRAFCHLRGVEQIRFRFPVSTSVQPSDSSSGFLPRKEVIQPHLPIRLPCYDFTPVIGLALGGWLLAVTSPTLGTPNSHGVTGGVYKARERIHRGMLIRDY